MGCELNLWAVSPTLWILIEQKLGYCKRQKKRQGPTKFFIPLKPMEEAAAPNKAFAETAIEDIPTTNNKVMVGMACRVVGVVVDSSLEVWRRLSVLHKSAIRRDRNDKRETDADARPIEYIPIDIIESFLMRMNPRDAVRLSGTCKEWRAIITRFNPTMRNTPWLLVTKIFKNSCRLQSVVDKEVSFKIRFHGFPSTRTLFHGCSHGWLVSDSNTPIHLLNPFSRAWLQLPDRQPTPYLFLCMSSAPTSPDCILLARDNLNHLCVWRPGDESWTLEKDKLQPFDAILSFEGQFYTWNHLGECLTIFQVLPLRLRKLVVPCPMVFTNANILAMSLVESRGNILLVCTVEHSGKSLGVYVFQLDLENETWIKMERLGDQALFVDRLPYNRAISVSAREAGCCANRIYFTNIRHPFLRNDFCVYNMDNHSIESFSRLSERRRHVCGDRRWITPILN
ncbi:unnamed protein product [Musa hybrid cultivar]